MSRPRHLRQILGTVDTRATREDATLDWRVDAACLEVDPELFFPEKGANSATVEAARRVCRGCAVITECLEDALLNPAELGIWAATTHQDRKRIRATRRNADPVPDAGESIPAQESA